MKTQPYLATFADRQTAHARMVQKNRACHAANNHREIYCLAPGPSDNWAVMDIATAIDLGLGYEWSF